MSAFDKPFRKEKNEPKPQTSTVAIQTATADPFTCLECKMIFKTENLLSKDINSRHCTVKANACSQTDEMDTITEDNFIEEMADSVDMNYKQEMKMEVIEVVDQIELEEVNVDMDDATSEHRSDLQTDYDILEKVHDEYQCNDCLEIFYHVELFQHHKCPNKVIVHIVNETTNTLGLDEPSDNYYEEMIHEVEIYECYRCHATFPNLENYAAHRISNDCQQVDSPSKIRNPRSKVDDYHNCNLCNKRFKTTTTFNQHLKLHEAIEIVIDYLDSAPCDDCHKIFLMKSQQLKHECPKKRKNSDGDYVDESCTDYQYLEQDSDFTCDVCSLEFSNLTTAKLHVVTHAKEFVCPFEGCGCSYEIWSRFAMHLGTKHLNGKRHQCRFCEVECESFDALQAHYKDECPEKKFNCDHCGETEISFVVNEPLLTHRRNAHSLFTEKSYFSQKALNLHIKDVTKGKTFNCTYCSKSFNRRGELDLHNRSHTNVR